MAQTLAEIRPSIGAQLALRRGMQKLDFGLVLAVVTGIASFLTAIYSTAYAVRIITPG